MFFVYALLVHLAFVLLLPLLLFHPRLRQGFGARLGFVRDGWPAVARRPLVWFHGASAGDLLAIEPMIADLRRLRPDCGVLVTTVTSSGAAVLERGLPGMDDSGFLPFDLPWAVGRVVERVRPDVLVLEYAEVWPALIRAVHGRGGRIVITNGRFHERALGRYRLLYRLIGNPLDQVDLLCMRDAAEAEHALAIGAHPMRVRVTGNTKFDRLRRLATSGQRPEVDVLAAAMGLDGAGPVLVAGSTHEGEEEILLDVFAGLRATRPTLRLILAPRYPERVPRVVALGRQRGFEVACRSEGARDEPVIVLDTVGELGSLYHLATLVFVGGSFVPRGGQNILEPAAAGRPVLFGPHMENFRDSVQMLIGRGGIQVTDGSRLEQTLGALLNEPEEMAKLGLLARQVVDGVQGASRANAEAIVGLLDPRREAPLP